MWPSQAQLIRKRKPTILLHLGDWVKNGSSLIEWMTTLHSLHHLGATPLITVRGNHDRGGRFERYGFSDHPSAPLRVTCIGPLIIFLLDTEADPLYAQEAVNTLLAWRRNEEVWSSNQLYQSGIKGMIWAQHRPIWSSGNHGSDERGWASWLVPALEELGIQLHLSGHDHDYERFCPSLGSGLQRTCHPSGITYLVSGGGASVTVPFPGLSWKTPSAQKSLDAQLREVFDSSPHYLWLSSEAKRLRLTMLATPREGVEMVVDDVYIPFLIP